MPFGFVRNEGDAPLKKPGRTTAGIIIYLSCAASLAVAVLLFLHLSSSQSLESGGARPGLLALLIIVLQLAVCVQIALVLRRLRRTPQRDADGDALLQCIRWHFLFNTLNATVHLIKPHPDVAEATLGRLTEIFRMMLSQKKQTTLAEEVRVTRRYVEIERLRLGAKLRVEWRLRCDETATIRVPSLILQPLIENAIYHGVEPRPEGGDVHVVVAARGRRLTLDVRNPATRVASHRHGNLVAQKNIRLRLQDAYGADFDFSGGQRAREYRVKINIPLERDHDERVDRG